MYKFKSYNYYNNLIFNYNLLYLDYLIKFNILIIYFNYNKLSNTSLLNLKNEIQKENCISLILKRSYINKIFFNYFKFLSSSMFCIFINNNIKFIKIINFLNNIQFFYSYKKIFSNIVTKNEILNEIYLYNNLKYIHYIIFKILYNILIIFFFFIMLLLKYI